MKKEVVDLNAGDVLHFPAGLYTDETTPFIVEKLQYLADNRTVRIFFTNGHTYTRGQFQKVEVQHENS